MSPVPPLRAAQVFEVVGRCGGITAAAHALGVSPGAITQQIHLLEKFLDVRLIQRSGRGIELTKWGAIYLPYVRTAMEELQRGGREVSRARRSNHMTVSALPSLTNRWLSSLILDWRNHKPNFTIDLVASENEPRLDEYEADFRISYGARLHCHQRYRYLFTDYVFPVASPTLLGGSRGRMQPQDVLNYPLLCIDWGPDHIPAPNWRDWLANFDVCDVPVRCHLTYSLSSAAIDAAADGRGLALAQHSMVAHALATGALVRLFDRCMPLREPYFLAWNGAALDSTQSAAFHSWLVNESRRFDWNTVKSHCP